MTQLIPNGKQQFVDLNGRPLVGGKVYFYSVGTSTPKNTYQDVGETILNTNPVILDARGQASIYGTGRYRQVLKTIFDVTIWDQVITDQAGELSSAIGDTADPSKGDALVGVKQPLPGSVARTQHDKNLEVVSVMDFGAIGDGTYHPLSERFGSLALAQVQYPFVTSLTQSIDWAAVQAGLNAGAGSPMVLDCHALVLVTTNPLTWKGGVFLSGVPGRCSIKLNNEANCSILVSDNFDFWAAWTSGSNAGYTLDGGVDGITFDGNAQFQTTLPTSAADMQYGLRIHSHRFQIGWLQVRRVNGIGLLTQYNSALMFSYRVDGVDDYGLQGDPRGSPSPYDFQQINIIDCLYEHFVFRGPADIPIWHVTTNYCGWLDNATIPLVARTSLLFPGEEIHSVRIEVACKVGYANLNGALYGRSLYVAPFVRFQADTMIVTGSWGAALISGSAFGSISALSIQQNTYAWGGVYKPHLEITFGTGSGANKNRFSFPQVSLRRLTTPVTANSIGPGILDNAGAQFGIIDGVDSNPVAGHALVIGPTNRGGIYESVNFDNIRGIAGDGTESCAVRVESGARDWRMDQLRLTNCSRGLVNFGVNMRGIVRDGTIETTLGDIAMEGVVPSSQVAGVIAGTGNIALDNIGSWGLELIYDGTRYYNRFKTTTTFVGATPGAQTSPSIPHTLWRLPAPRDLATSLQWGGTTWPNVNAGIKSISTSDFVASAYVHTASAGTLTLSIQVL